MFLRPTHIRSIIAGVIALAVSGSLALAVTRLKVPLRALFLFLPLNMKA